eukprot:TRINITY_DN10891_c0_g2_i2.p1 TRINITY_DN10891_c0_g2~~TRINITY_DN10891_c0_g2_i2.p1  ORF type:complete len:126 (-),score=8.86 TRINITY_DN10891_c0_g2_i2:75-452(-)
MSSHHHDEKQPLTSGFYSISPRAEEAWKAFGAEERWQALQREYPVTPPKFELPRAHYNLRSQVHGGPARSVMIKQRELGSETGRISPGSSLLSKRADGKGESLAMTQYEDASSSPLSLLLSLMLM